MKVNISILIDESLRQQNNNREVNDATLSMKSISRRRREGAEKPQRTPKELRAVWGGKERRGKRGHHIASEKTFLERRKCSKHTVGMLEKKSTWPSEVLTRSITFKQIQPTYLTPHYTNRNGNITAIFERATSAARCWHHIIMIRRTRRNGTEAPPGAISLWLRAARPVAHTAG